MTILKKLVLASPNFSDAALDRIVRHPCLQLLNLNGTRISDVGLKRLHGMKCPLEIMLGKTLVTETVVQELRRKLPNCKVYWPKP